MARKTTRPHLDADDKVDLYLEEQEVTALRKAASKIGRNGHRDATMILLAFNHGLRASEVCRLKWQHVSLEKRSMHIVRVKGSKSGPHPLFNEEVKALRKLGDEIGYVFKSEARQAPGPVSESGFHKIVKRAGKVAGLGSNVHPHQLRHACGHRCRLDRWSLLDTQEWLGHVNAQNTQRYAAADADHFRRLINEKEGRIDR